MDAPKEDGIGVKAARIIYPLFIGQVFGIIFTALTFIVVARLLGPASYGLYTFAFGFSALVNGFLAFGVGPYFSSNLARLAYKKDGEGIMDTLNSGYVIAGAMGVVLTIFGVAVSGPIAAVFVKVGISPLVLMLASGTIISSILNTLGISALIGLSRAGLSAVVNILVDIMQLALSVALALAFGVAGAVAAMLIGYAIGAAIGAYLVYRVVSKRFKFRIYFPPIKRIGEVFSVVWPLGATNFLNTGMQNFSILFLGLYVSTAVLGNYGAASRGLALLSAMYLSIGSGLLPIFATAKAMGLSDGINATYNKIIRFTMIIMLPVIVYVGAFAAPGLYLLVGAEYTLAPFYLALIAAGTMIGLFGTYMNQLLISGGKTFSVLRINFVSALIQLVLMVALVPYYKVVGAIIAIFFIGNMVEAALFARDARLLLGLKLEFRKLLLLYAGNIALGLAFVAASLAAGVAAMPLGISAGYAAALACGIVAFVIFYPAILVAFRVIDKGDISGARGAMQKLGKVSAVFDPLLDYSERLRAMLNGG